MSKDLRTWIARLESEGELRRVKAKVDWNLEIAAIQRETMARKGPALLFENIKDHEKTWCHRLLVNGIGTSDRVALMLGLPKTATQREIVTVLRKRFKSPIPPVTVKTGPVKENIIRGRDVDLGQIPVPKWHPFDAGRYINTFCAVVTRDPESGVHNAGIYRGMIRGKNRIPLFMQFAQDWGNHFNKYRTVGKPMPVAMVYGWDPSLVVASGIAMSTDEYGAMGALMQEPVPLVKCETSDIMVPASAEIVVEGTISPDPADWDFEGPYGESSGYYAQAARRPTATIKCITHRDNPIFRGGFSESGPMWRPAFAALAWNHLEQLSIPGILDVEVGTPWVVKIHKTYQGQARQIAAALWGSRLAVASLKLLVVTDDERDIDIHDMSQVMRIIGANTHIPHGIVAFPAELGPATDAAISIADKDEFAYGQPIANRLLIDATVDWTMHPPNPEWGGRRVSPDANTPPPEVLALVRKRWKEYRINRPGEHDEI
jgi:4-hydroxy-3-polyprenylbenzoate decarboxylase